MPGTGARVATSAPATSQPNRSRRGRVAWWAWVLLALALIALGAVLWVRFGQDLFDAGAGQRQAPDQVVVIAPYGSGVTAAPKPLAWPEPVWAGTAEIHAQTGAELLIDDPASPLAGLSIVVPPGAVPLGAPLELKVGYAPEAVDYQPRDLLQEDGALYTQLVARVEAANADPASDVLYDPILAPMALALGEYDQISPVIALEPAGTTFAYPVRVTLPVQVEDPADLTEPLGLLVLGRSVAPDGTISWEVNETARYDAATSTVSFETTHFSDWSAWVWQRAKNVPYVAGLQLGIGKSEIEALKARLPQDTFTDLVTAVVCGSKPAVADWGKMPGQWDLLMFLGWGGGGSQGILDPVFARSEQALEQWLRSQSPRLNPGTAGTRAPGSIGPGEIFARALDFAEGDIAQALVACHSVLRKNQRSQPVQELLRPYRPDGLDQPGAYYHLFGSALYAFAYRHYQQTALGVEWQPPLDPERVVRAEEAFVSGDIQSDPMEYAVDLQGIDLGRQLYDQVLGRTREDLARAFGIDPRTACVMPVLLGSSTALPVATGVARGGLAGRDDQGQLVAVPAQTDSSGMGVLSNAIVLNYFPAGGAVTGEGLFAYREIARPEHCPGVVDEARMTMAFTGTYDAAGGTMSGTVQLGGYTVIVQIDCSTDRTESDGLAPGTWSATLSGNTIVGTLINQHGEPTPFLLTVGG